MDAKGGVGADRQHAVFEVRPRRVRWVCGITAIAVFAVFAAVSTALTGKTEGGGVFHRSDQVAMVVLGALIALGIMAFARPRVRADETGIRVRNIIGGYELPWEVVRAVRFSRHSPWASLELADDDEVTLMAVQAADKDYALDAVRTLRRMLAAHGGAAGTQARP
ncbi:MAG: PH domain-containing protein [Actinocatenispora sp.]